jgi:septal ring factor EnvC (AmiA/AmiB activator)
MKSKSRLVNTLVLGLALLFAVQISHSQNLTRKQLEKRREALKAEMVQLNRLRQSNKKKEISLLTQVEDIDQQIKVRSDLIRVTNRQANLLTSEIEENLNKLENLRNELKLLKTDYAEMIQKSYKSRSDQSKIMFLLSSKSFAQAYKRTQYMKQYAAYRKKQGEQIKERATLLQQVNTDLLEQKAAKETLIAENRKAKAQLDKEKKMQDKLVKQLRKKSSTYAAQIRKKQQETDKIDKQIDKIIADAIAASNKKAGRSTSSKGFALTPEGKAIASDFTSSKGRLIWPVERGRVTRPYGESRHPTLPNIKVKNSGIDIETLENATVRAVFKGEVLGIVKVKGAGLVVSIRHGDYITVYSNIKNLTVQEGDKVAFKQKIGEVGKNAFSGKSVMKFRIQKNRTKLNPSVWVAKR